MIILIRAAVFGTNTTYVCYYDLTRSAMSGSKRQRVTPQQRDDFATCSASEQQWLERNSKMTIAGCNEELGFPIAQVDEVMHMVMHTYIINDAHADTAGVGLVSATQSGAQSHTKVHSS